MRKRSAQFPTLSFADRTALPSAGFPRQIILCITLCLSTVPQMVGPSAVAVSLFFSTPTVVYADPLNTMKAREFLQKGNNHLTRFEFQQALDAYTECLLCDPTNRTAKDNIVLTHNNWGIWWFQKRKYKEAREEWEQALKLNPMDRNARANMQVLKVTLKQQGLSEDGEKPKPPQAQAQKPSADFPPSQAIILTPGLKSSGGTAGGSTEASSEGQSASTAPSSSSTVPTSTSTTPRDEGNSSTTGSSSGASLWDGGAASPTDGNSGSAVIIKKTAPVTTSGGESSGAISTYSSGSNYSNETTGAKFTTAPITPAKTQSSSQSESSESSAASAAATAGGSQGDNIEDSLGQIEQKIYGRKQDSLPIMKRLEKLEIDTHGKTKSGTIKERIDTLRKSYGF